MSMYTNFISIAWPNGMMLLFYLVSFFKSRRLETNPARNGLNYYMLAFSVLNALAILYAILDIANSTLYIYSYLYLESYWFFATIFTIIGIYLFNHKETSK